MTSPTPNHQDEESLPGPRPDDLCGAEKGPLPPVADLRHYARRSLTDLGGAIEVVDRQFDFVTAALPITYGWMMGYPPGWLSRALRSAVLAERLALASSSKPSVTPSSPRSRKRSASHPEDGSGARGHLRSRRMKNSPTSASPAERPAMPQEAVKLSYTIAEAAEAVGVCKASIWKRIKVAAPEGGGRLMPPTPPRRTPKGRPMKPSPNGIRKDAMR